MNETERINRIFLSPEIRAGNNVPNSVGSLLFLFIGKELYE